MTRDLSESGFLPRGRRHLRHEAAASTPLFNVPPDLCPSTGKKRLVINVPLQL
jgi:hypothetical protein